MTAEKEMKVFIRLVVLLLATCGFAGGMIGPAGAVQVMIYLVMAGAMIAASAGLLIGAAPLRSTGLLLATFSLAMQASALPVGWDALSYIVAALCAALLTVHSADTIVDSARC